MPNSREHTLTHMFTSYICDLWPLGSESLAKPYVTCPHGNRLCICLWSLVSHYPEEETQTTTSTNPPLWPPPHLAAIWYRSTLPPTARRSKHTPAMFSWILIKAPRGETHFVDCRDWPLHLQEQHSGLLGGCCFFSLWWWTYIIRKVHCSVWVSMFVVSLGCICFYASNVGIGLNCTCTCVNTCSLVSVLMCAFCTHGCSYIAYVYCEVLNKS